ncbi:transglycosylase domain-containing protein [Sporosarcina sp. FA9]|uniref:transglycosylase domain-containing protein n=1 Tax=Sporosarcina sp. FA9 TaxID=3413030 RepID=UPI003F658081
MRQLVGYFIIIMAFPILFFVQKSIVSEINNSNSFKNYILDSIELSTPEFDVPIVMKDRNGIPFLEEYIEWREPLLLVEIPYFARQLFLLSEDNGFYEHKGYDVTAIARAFIANTKTDNLSQGGSTITQQLVRMRFLSTDKTYERKVTELFYAAELEKQSNKDEILEMYLNEMYFGNQVYGIGAAATYYFSRPLTELNEAEIAFISAIPNNPARYDPIVHFEQTKKRQELLLDTLVRNEVMSVDEANVLKSTSIDLVIKKKLNEFPTYSTYILSELKQLIGNIDGFTKKIIEATSIEEKVRIEGLFNDHIKNVLSSGIIVETALEPSKQRKDEQAITRLLKPVGLQAGAAVIDNDTREIISLYGGKDYQKADFNRAYQAFRQPGSAIKPLLVYAPFFESGGPSYTENMIVSGGKLCIGTYCPINYGGYVYGNVTIKEAFRLSHNTAAVRVFDGVGIEEAFSFLEPFEFQSITKEDEVYPAALGGFTKGVTPLELAGAYSGFIDGMYIPVRGIRSVKDKNNTILYEWNEEKIEVWSPTTTTIIRDLLKDVVVNGTGRGISYMNPYTGAKTGTTNSDKDLWVAGMNEQYTTAVWVGYDQPQSMSELSKQKIHLQMFSTLLRE